MNGDRVTKLQLLRLYLLLLFVGVVSGQSCEYLPFVDGCSHSPNFIKKFMAKACVRHDLCYGCGIKFGFSRSFCDDTFHLDTISICDFKAPLFNSLCKSLASFMSFSVRLLGEKRYKWVYPEPWCDLPEVRHCLPPFPLKMD